MNLTGIAAGGSTVATVLSAVSGRGPASLLFVVTLLLLIAKGFAYLVVNRVAVAEAWDLFEKRLLRVRRRRARRKSG